MTDCSNHQKVTHDHREWKAVYVGALAERMTATGDGDDWSQQHAGCSQKGNMVADYASIGKQAQPA